MTDLRAITVTLLSGWVDDVGELGSVLATNLILPKLREMSNTRIAEDSTNAMSRPE